MCILRIFAYFGSQYYLVIILNTKNDHAHKFIVGPFLVLDSCTAQVQGKKAMKEKVNKRGSKIVIIDF